MTHVISVINLKGGVGKTVTSAALADVFSAELKKKVLLIDLDPQTNLTLLMISELKWKELNDHGQTLAQLFKDTLTLNNDEKKFDLKSALQKKVGTVTEARTIDLLPSSLDLIDLQDNLPQTLSGAFYSSPVEILKRGARDIFKNYDIVIIDCPPNLGFITLNGLLISQGFIIPTVPDYLSTYGIPQILGRVSKFSKFHGLDIIPLGIVITKYQANSNVHRNGLRRLQKNSKSPKKVYNSIIRQTNIATEATEFTELKTLRQKYGSGEAGLTQPYINLAEEIWQDLENIK